jgi:putative FmdB family regulatory protein
VAGRGVPGGAEGHRAARAVQAGEGAMPMYEFYCSDCRKEVSLVLTMKEREEGAFACPECKGKNLEPLLAGFFAKTSRKC